MTFDDTLRKISGLTHYYPLDDSNQAKDVVGTQHGTASGVKFGTDGATFNGSASISLGDHNDFSVATKGGLSIVVFITIADWRGKGASEYVHWAGKGKAGAHEWTFRHYVKGGSGEASSRQGRMSFYHYNPSGGLGAGSYYQDSSFPTNERVVVATGDMRQVQLYVEGKLRDTDALSGYSVVPKNTASPAMLGTRGDGTGFLIGKIRRVAFFNRVLTPTEVSSIYAARGESGGGVTPPVEPPVVDPPTTDPLLVDLSGDVTAMEVAQAHNALVKKLNL